MRKFNILLLLLGPALFQQNLSAHDASKHKGKGTTGEISSVTSDGLQLKTSAGLLKITLTADTRIEHGDAPSHRSHLMKGAKVTVFGTKLPGGEIVAREVVIAGGPAGKGATTPKKTRSGTR